MLLLLFILSNDVLTLISSQEHYDSHDDAGKSFDLIETSMNKPMDVPSRSQVMRKRSPSLTSNISKRSGDLWFVSTNHFPPQPYSFGYEVRDSFGNSQYRRESSDPSGAVTGSYGYYGPDGLYRHVTYVADEGGYRATMTTSEPGIGSEDPANVRVTSFPSLPSTRNPPSLPRNTPPPLPPPQYNNLYSYSYPPSYSTTSTLAPSVLYDDYDLGGRTFARRRNESPSKTSTKVNPPKSSGKTQITRRTGKNTTFSPRDIQVKEEEVVAQQKRFARLSRNFDDEEESEVARDRNNQNNKRPVKVFMTDPVNHPNPLKEEKWITVEKTGIEVHDNKTRSDSIREKYLDLKSLPFVSTSTTSRPSVILLGGHNNLHSSGVTSFSPGLLEVPVNEEYPRAGKSSEEDNNKDFSLPFLENEEKANHYKVSKLVFDETRKFPVTNENDFSRENLHVSKKASIVRNEDDFSRENFHISKKASIVRNDDDVDKDEDKEEGEEEEENLKKMNYMPPFEAKRIVTPSVTRSLFTLLPRKMSTPFASSTSTESSSTESPSTESPTLLTESPSFTQPGSSDFSYEEVSDQELRKRLKKEEEYSTSLEKPDINYSLIDADQEFVSKKK